LLKVRVEMIEAEIEGEADNVGVELEVALNVGV